MRRRSHYNGLGKGQLALPPASEVISWDDEATEALYYNHRVKLNDFYLLSKPPEEWAPFMTDFEVEWLPWRDRLIARQIRYDPIYEEARASQPEFTKELERRCEPNTPDYEFLSYSDPGWRPREFWNRPWREWASDILDTGMAILPFVYRFRVYEHRKQIIPALGPTVLIDYLPKETPRAFRQLDYIRDELEGFTGIAGTRFYDEQAERKQLQMETDANEDKLLWDTGKYRWPRLVFPSYLDVSRHRAFMRADGALEVYGFDTKEELKRAISSATSTQRFWWRRFTFPEPRPSPKPL